MKVVDVLMNAAKNCVPHQQAAKNVSLLNNRVLNLTRAKGFTILKRTSEYYVKYSKALYYSGL